MVSRHPKPPRFNVSCCWWLIFLLPRLTCSTAGIAVNVTQRELTDTSADSVGIQQAGAASSAQQQATEGANFDQGANFDALTLTPQTTSTSAGAQSRFQQYPPICRPDLATPPVQPGSVTLLRISTLTLQATSPDSPPSFQVDSTIMKLVIQVASTDPLSTIIVDPNGESINSRSRRDVVRTHNQWKKTLRHTDFRQLASPNLTLYSQTHRHLLLNRRMNIYSNFKAMLSNRIYGRGNTVNILKPRSSTAELSHSVKGISRRYESYDGTAHPRSPPGGRGKYHRSRSAKQAASLDNRGPDDARRPRRTRSAHVTNTRTSEETVRWDIDSPPTGLWSISTTGAETANITIMAVTSFDFRFEFFDLTMNAMNYPPIANENTLMRLYMNPVQCVVNITRLDLLDDAGLVIGSVDSVDLSRGPDDDTGIATLLVMSPSVPFYVCLRGYDVMGLRFQRISPVRVVPRMFVISVSHRPDPPLTPGREHRFNLFLRNKDRRDRFKISVQFSNQYFTAKVPQAAFMVNPGELMPLFLAVNVSEGIYFQETSVMIVTARRISDNLTDIVSENLTAVPSLYKTDHEPPTCSVESTQGGCRPGLSCGLQRWTVAVLVADGQTGVASANFVNTETGTYTNIQFSYVTRNHTAIASYRYTCCNPEAVLEVKDYANNTGRCLLEAPRLDPMTPATPKATLIPTRAPNTSTVSEIFNRSPVPPKITPARPVLFTNSPVPTVQSPREGLVAGYASDSGLRTTESLSAVTEESKTPIWRITPRGSAAANITHKKLESWDDDKYSTLKLGAIIVGSIGGTAGLAIILVCASYKCAHRKPATRAGRQGSNASDITMGSSWEGRSDTSSGTDSIRLKKIIESDNSSMELGTSGYVSSNEKSSEVQSILNNKETKLDDRERISKGVHFRQQRNIRVAGMRRSDDDVDDVVFRCVVVGEENSAFGRPSSVKRLEHEASHSATYSPMLKSAGKTYANMLEVQEKMMEMEAQRKSLTSGTNQNPGRSQGQYYEMASQKRETGLMRQETETSTHPPRMGTQRQHAGRIPGQLNSLDLHQDQKGQSGRQYEYVVQIHQPRLPARQVGPEHRQVGSEHRQVGPEHRQVGPEHRHNTVVPGRDVMTPGSPKIGINHQAQRDGEFGQEVTCACLTDVNDLEVPVQQREPVNNNISADYYPRKFHINARQSLADNDVGAKTAPQLPRSKSHPRNRTAVHPVQLCPKTEPSSEILHTRHPGVLSTSNSNINHQGSVRIIQTDKQLTGPTEGSPTHSNLHSGEIYAAPCGAGQIREEAHGIPTPDFRRRVLEQNFNFHRRRVSAPSVACGAHEDVHVACEPDSAHRASQQTATSSSTRVLHTSPDPSYVHRGRFVPGSPPHRRVPTVITISDQSQWELHHNIQHVRDKLLLLQSKVDRNLEVDAKHVKSGSDSD